MDDKKTNNKKNLIFYFVLFLLVLLSFSVYFIVNRTKEPETEAVVHLGSKEVLRADLSKDAKYVILDGEAQLVDMDYSMASIGEGALQKHDVNIILIQDQQVSCVEANCPDLTCVHIAAMDAKSDGIPIACLPHGLVISIE